MTRVKVIGLDLSLSATGIAHHDGRTSVLDTPASKKIRGEVHRFDGPGRLAEIRNEVARACEITDLDLEISGLYRPNPRLVVIEGYSMGTVSNRAYSTGELGGVIRLLLHEGGVPFLVVPPKTLKKFATGSGNANKPEMIANARERLGYGGFDDNEADALWLRALGCEMLGQSIVTLPQTHLAALAKLRLPAEFRA